VNTFGYISHEARSRSDGAYPIASSARFFSESRSAGRVAEIAAHHLDDRLGEGDFLPRVDNLVGSDVARHHHQREIAHHLR
jgi:hypothetical protein